MTWAEPLAAALLRASLEGALLVALVALLIRALPRLPAAARSALWWAACLKLLLALAWPAPIELPWLPATTPGEMPADSIAASVGEMAANPAAAVTLPEAETGAVREVPADSTAPTGREMAAMLLIALWAGGFGVLVVRAGRQLGALRGTLRGARTVDDPALLERLTVLAHRAGVRTPRLLVSERPAAPQVTGLLRPAVLLPAAAVCTGGTELDMILSHELAHLRRRDLLFGWVPALAARLFFFHPLAAIAAREYALAREAACDAEALRLVGAAPRDYGRMLLTWGTAREGGLLAAASLGDTHDLKRRLHMLHQTTTRRGRWPLLTFAAVLPVLLLLLPVRLTPARAAPGPDADGARSHWSWSDGGGQPLVLLHGDDKVSFNADMADTARAEAARRGGEDLLWFEQGRTAYVVRDAATLKRARQALEPVFDLAEQQGELGARQGELGGEQGELGGRQGELGAEMGRLGAEMGALGAELGAVVSQQVALEMSDGDEAAVAEMEARERKIEAEMEALESEMEALGDDMEALGDQQEAMGERQAEMGERQAALGAKQAEASERAMEKLDRILEEAVRSGKAERME